MVTSALVVQLGQLHYTTLLLTMSHHELTPLREICPSPIHFPYYMCREGNVCLMDMAKSIFFESVDNTSVTPLTITRFGSKSELTAVHPRIPSALKSAVVVMRDSEVTEMSIRATFITIVLKN